MRAKQKTRASEPEQLRLAFPKPVAPLPATSEVPIDCTFPEAAADQLARIESFNKHLYRPNTYLHKWWARRSGTTFRHILKQLILDPTSRDYYAPAGLEGKVILDPMMGGATTLHEAIRMGANVVGIDIDPIPVTQARATLQLRSPTQSRELFSRLSSQVHDALAPLFRTVCPLCGQTAETQFVLYGLRRRCACGEALFVDSYKLRENRDEDVMLCPACYQVYIGPSHVCQAVAKRPLQTKGSQRCTDCGTPFEDLVREPFVSRYVPLVVAGVCPVHGQFFEAAHQADQQKLEEARRLAAGIDFGNVLDFQVPDGPKSRDLLRRGITSFLELFTPRQLLYLKTCLDFASQTPRDDRLWLSLLVSTSLEFNSLLCGYKGSDIRRPGAVRHVFSHHAYSFPYTALENNPVFSGSSSGTLTRLFEDRVARAGEWALHPREVSLSAKGRQQVIISGETDGGQLVKDWDALASGSRQFLVLQADSSALAVPQGAADFVVTDPPYYDNVQYSDLSMFFRVWLRRLLPGEADWDYNPLASAVSEGDASGNAKYGEVLAGIWKTCHTALRPELGRLVFTFHHWKHEAWAELTVSLRRAQFSLVNRYVVFSENPTSVHIKGLKALEHDAILVLRPARADAPPAIWARLHQIDTSDSYRFCGDCGTALGYCLSANLDDQQIRAHWQELFLGGTNGKTTS